MEKNLEIKIKDVQYLKYNKATTKLNLKTREESYKLRCKIDVPKLDMSQKKPVLTQKPVLTLV